MNRRGRCRVKEIELNADKTPTLNCGRRGRIRTCNRRIRNPMLYPFELRALNNLQLVCVAGGSGSASLTCQRQSDEPTPTMPPSNIITPDVIQFPRRQFVAL